MNKELTPLESWKEVKDYIECCFGYKNSCLALQYNSTSLFLEPHINNVEKSLKDYEKLKALYNNQISTITALIEENKDNEKKLKALEIIKNKRVDVFQLLIAIKLNDLNEYNKRHAEYLHLTQEEYDLLKEVLL